MTFSGFVSSLLTESKETAMSQLLVYLPLLRPGNVDAKSRYLAVVPRVLSHSTETGAQLEEARQLHSYSLIHPAFTPEDKRLIHKSLKNSVPTYSLRRQCEQMYLIARCQA